MSPIIVVVQNPKQAMRKAIYAYGLDRQWAIATYTVASNYFRFATIMLDFTHNQFSNIVDLQTL